MKKTKKLKPIPSRIYPAEVDTTLVAFCFTSDPESVRLAADDLARMVLEKANIKIQIANEALGME
jgi:predicted metal-binding protein